MTEQSKHRHRVVVSKKWHTPEIVVAIHAEAPGAPAALVLEMSVEDYMLAIVAEMGPKRWAFTEAKFKSEMVKASSKIIEEMKAQSIHMHQLSAFGPRP